MIKTLLFFFFLASTIALVFIFSIYAQYPVNNLKFKYPVFSKSRKLASWSKNKPDYWLGRQNMKIALIWPIIINEDTYFYEHSGINFKEVINSLIDTIIDKKKLRGASTISMQLARNLFLNQERTFSRKFREIIIAKKIEHNLHKDKILEIYLNIVEFSPGIHGIKEALDYFFPLEKVYSFKHGAYLAQALPNPRDFGKKYPTKLIIERIRSVVKKLKRDAVINKVEKEKILSNLFF